MDRQQKILEWDLHFKLLEFKALFGLDRKYFSFENDFFVGLVTTYQIKD